MNNISIEQKNKYANISLLLGILPVLLLFLGIVIGFAFGPSGLAIGGILTIGIFCLMPISNIIGLYIGVIRIIKKETSAKLFLAFTLNITFIILYILYFIGMMGILKQ